MNQVKGAIQDELDAYFEYADTSNASPILVSKAAFSKARQYLKSSAFSELRDMLNNDFYASNHAQTWNGFRLCAVDCSTLTLPNNDEMMQQFGGRKNAYADIPQATFSQCFDPLNGFTLDSSLSRSNACERTLALQHLHKIKGDNVFIYDRGYPGFWFYSAHFACAQHFCMRVSTSHNCHYIHQFIQSDATDTIVSVSASSKATKKCDELGYPSQPIQLRLIKVTLPSGETEVLATNLWDKSLYPEESFSALYFKRWGVEEDFKQQKHTLLIERFSGKNLTAVMQDIEAKLLTKNIACLVSKGTETQLELVNRHRKHRYQVNFKQLLSKCKHMLVNSFVTNKVGACVIKLIDSMMRYIEPVREGRKYARKRAVGTRNATHGTYKGVR